MAYYKIKNITNSLGKRHPRFNSTQVIENKGLMRKVSTTIQPGQEIIIECDFLPISAQQLRLKGYLLIQEINKNEYLKLVKASEPKTPAPVAKENESTDSSESTKQTKIEGKRKHKNSENS